jgi:hypothetical protein
MALVPGEASIMIVFPVAVIPGDRTSGRAGT